MAMIRNAFSHLKTLGTSSLRSPKLINSPSLMHVRCVTLKSSPYQQPEEIGHDQRNAALKRPLSPHLFIYKLQLTSVMSISHRITGLILTSYAAAFAGASFLSTDIPHIAAAIQDIHIPSPIIFLIKYIIAFPVAYHLFNGIRHLLWDMGIGLTLKEVYLSGYITLAATIMLSIYLSVK